MAGYAGSSEGAARKYIVAVDQGTSSTRAILFDTNGDACHTSQQEFTQHYPQHGWCEHDPMEIMASVEATITKAMKEAKATAADIVAVGITNQRETTVAWDKKTGKPLHNAIVWLDNRTADISKRLIEQAGLDRFRATTGLPVSTYFSAVKIVWLIENVPAVKEAVTHGNCCFGTIDSWLIYNLTGGVDGGLHATDVTNASRYMLMDLATLAWHEGICEELGIPISTLPEIRSSAEEYGKISSGVLAGVPIAAALGDQQSALLGQGCLGVGDIKSTYGTGLFILMNTGERQVDSKHGLLTTVGFKLGRNAKTTYALEGAVAIAGRGIQWLRDSLDMIKAAPEIGPLAESVHDTGGVTFVPAFQGLLAPYWDMDARASITGMSLATTKAHIARALLKGVAMQACDVKAAMEADAGCALKTVKVDGGMTQCDPAMQIQVDLLGKPILRAKMPEATALGSAFAAGLAMGVWSQPSDIQGLLEHAGGATKFEPTMAAHLRADAHREWKDCVQQSIALGKTTAARKTSSFSS
eukprot:TRINITY_DN24034_c0_g1_i1.p1 TRINITY_DN24034_c0_g1~~TRINITY_DN24034_c0_g1_i1.p1  ORF type:complete len:527 (+),score=117.07 TRINITY_DN24034_c0_g1_i1:88-1668(+)